jgi:hypothetical protein
MNASQPPRLATWLLQRWGSGPKREFLVGDLLEQYQRGRSSAWYWRQTMTTILIGGSGDLRDHPWLGVRAIVMGWVIYLLPFPGTWQALWRASLHSWGLNLQLAGEVPVYLVCVVGGWMVARLHRHHAAGAVGVYTLTVLLFEYGHMSWMFWRHGHPPMPLAVLLFPAFLAIGRPLGILVGGLCGTRAEDHAVSLGSSS